MAEYRLNSKGKYVSVGAAVVAVVGALTLGVAAPAGARTAVSRADSGHSYPSVSSAALSGRTVLLGTRSPEVSRARLESRVAGPTAESFQVTLEPRDPSAVSALASAVSDPRSSQFHHYLTAAQWESRFSPTLSQVAAVTGWLRSEGLKVGSVSADRLSISGSGSAARVERAFGVTLNVYDVGGQDLQLLATDASVPASMGGFVQGVLGLGQSFATPDIAGPAVVPNASESAPPPAAYREQVSARSTGPKFGHWQAGLWHRLRRSSAS